MTCLWACALWKKGWATLRSCPLKASRRAKSWKKSESTRPWVSSPTIIPDLSWLEFFLILMTNDKITCAMMCDYRWGEVGERMCVRCSLLGRRILDQTPGEGISPPLAFKVWLVKVALEYNKLHSAEASCVSFFLLFVLRHIPTAGCHCKRLCCSSTCCRHTAQLVHLHRRVHKLAQFLISHINFELPEIIFVLLFKCSNCFHLFIWLLDHLTTCSPKNNNLGLNGIWDFFVHLGETWRNKFITLLCHSWTKTSKKLLYKHFDT